ncbi:MAG: potassium/proton antiporter [Paludibacteraceae bacterium]|nr:potassium/proton antiporter [Paludibacteraceae bacterium]
MEVEFFLLTLSLLFFASILSDKVSSKFGVPSLLLFLIVGMLFGTDGIGIKFDNIGLAEAIGSIGLSIILFSGGMDTKFREIQPVVKEGIVLSTIGVLLTAVITGLLIWLLISFTHAGIELALGTSLLMAATMASTDSASVFSILRGQNIKLKHNLKPLLELESGSNDPMASVLTILMISVVTAGGHPNVWLLIFDVLSQLVIGLLLGFLAGKFLVWLMNKVNISNESLYPILVLTSCIFIFAVTSFTKGNAFLAVYIGGLVFGNSKFAHKRSTVNFLDGITWLSQLTMFLTLGLLVTPHELIDKRVLALGFAASGIMIFISRPISVFLSLTPFRKLPFKALTFVSWVGLKGASPILFSILCLAENVPNARLIFNVVFLCTLVSLLVQGMSLTKMAKWLGMADANEPQLKKVESFDIDLPEEIKSVATEINISADMLEHGSRLMDMGFPQNTLVIMVKRGTQFFVPTGKSILQEGDNLLVITDNEQTLQATYQQIEDNRQEKKPKFLDDTIDFTREFINMIRENHKIKQKRRKAIKLAKKQLKKKNNISKPE